jgi:multiple sugar transport system permease protein
MGVHTAIPPVTLPSGDRTSRKNREQPRRYLLPLLLPAVIVLAVLTIYPFIWLIYMSLHEVVLAPGQPDAFTGGTHWREMFSDPQYWHGWLLLARFSAISMVLEIGLGTLLAVLVSRSRHEKLLVTVLLMPMMVAPVVAGLLWQFLYNGTFGWYYWLLRSVGIMHGGSILGSTGSALNAIIIVDVWEWTPLIALIVLAGLKVVPQDQLEASSIDGAGPVRNFMRVALPNIRGALLIAILLRFMDNVRIIDHFIALTGGGPANSTKILPLYLYERSFSFFQLGYGSAIALTLLLITIILGKLTVSWFESSEKKQARHFGAS